MQLKDLKSLFLHELRDLYSAEKQLTKALPKMAKATTNEELRQAFEKHLQETEKQIERLDEVFKELDATPHGTKCAAMEGLIEEAKELLEKKAEPRVLDAALICAAQARRALRDRRLRLRPLAGPAIGDDPASGRVAGDLERGEKNQRKVEPVGS